MIEEFLILQGADIDAELIVKQKDLNVLDMSTADRIIVVLYDGYRTVHAKWKNGSALAGYYLIDTTDANTGKLKLKVLTEVTKELKPGKYFFEIRVDFPSGVHTDDSKYTVPVNQYAFSVRESQINKIDPLP